jgi:hypothetical protein
MINEVSKSFQDLDKKVNRKDGKFIKEMEIMKKRRDVRNYINKSNKKA